MRRTASSDGVRLKADFVSSELGPMAPDVDEWLRAKCVSFPQPGYSKVRAWWRKAPRDLWEDITMVFNYAKEHDDKGLGELAIDKLKCITNTLAVERYAAWTREFVR